MRKILIIDKMHPSITSMFEEAGFLSHYRPEIRRGELLEVIGEYQGLVVRSKTPIDVELISQASNLEFVARAGAGVDQLDVEALEKAGIEIFNAPEGNRDAVGEHAVGGLLSLFHKINMSDRKVREGIWNREESRGIELKGMTVGIVGYGNMGRAFAQRLSGFECEVLAFDKYKVSYGDAFAREAELDEIVKKADVLSFHVPLTEETQAYFDREFVSSFEKPFFLINFARGEVAMLDPIVWGLETGKIRGAVLDVLENEKFKTFTESQKSLFARLVEREDVIFSPHVGGWTQESYRRINEVLVRKIKSYYGIA